MAHGARGLSDAKLKVIGLVLVAASVVDCAYVQSGLPSDITQASVVRLSAAVILEIVSWAAFPIYAWFLYAGFKNSRNLWAYGARLVALAVVCEVPYDLVTSGKAWDMSSQNPVMGLVVALIVLLMLRWAKQLSKLESIAVSTAVIIAGALWLLLFNVGMRMGLMPGGVLTLAFVLIFYFLDGRENTTFLVGGIVGAIAGVLPALGFVVLHFRNEEPVREKSTRYVFYVLYPVLLLAGGLIRTLM